MDKVREKDGVGRRVEVGGGGEVIRKKFAPASKWERVKIWKQKKKKRPEPTFTLSLFFFFSSRTVMHLGWTPKPWLVEPTIR